MTRRYRSIAIIAVLALIMTLIPAETFATTAGTPRLNSIMQVTSTSATISWQRSENTVGYAVYRSTSKNGTYTRVKTTTLRSYTNKNLIVGKTYYYKVKAYRKSFSKKIYGEFSNIRKIMMTNINPVVTMKVPDKMNADGTMTFTLRNSSYNSKLYLYGLADDSSGAGAMIYPGGFVNTDKIAAENSAYYSITSIKDTETGRYAPSGMKQLIMSPGQEFEITISYIAGSASTAKMGFDNKSDMLILFADYKDKVYDIMWMPDDIVTDEHVE